MAASLIYMTTTTFILRPGTSAIGPVFRIFAGTNSVEFFDFPSARSALVALTTGAISWDDLLFDLYGSGPDDVGCECELDWRCGLHAGMHTPLELINDAFATAEADLDRYGF